MEASITHNWNIRDFAPPAGAASRHDEHLFTAINRWNWFPAVWVTLRAGGDYRLSYLDSTDMGLVYRHDGGVYLTGEFQLHETFLVIPSAKGVFSGPGAGAPAVAVPKLGLLWTPTDYFSIKNNYFRSFKHPAFQDLYWGADSYTRGNPDLKPEDGWGTDLGLTYQSGNITVGSTFFAQWTVDSVHWAQGAGGIWQPENVGEAAFFGSENKAKITIPLKGPFTEIGISLSYQFLLGYLLSYGYTWSSEKRIPYMPMHTFGASLDIPWTLGSQKRAGSFIISGHFETTRYADTANLKILDPYFLLNININQELSGTIAAFLAVHNALNTSYESFNDYPMPGITVTVGLNVNIGGSRE
jgi:vitamin B12 transporter